MSHGIAHTAALALATEPAPLDVRLLVSRIRAHVLEGVEPSEAAPFLTKARTAVAAEYQSSRPRTVKGVEVAPERLGVTWGDIAGLSRPDYVALIDGLKPEREPKPGKLSKAEQSAQYAELARAIKSATSDDDIAAAIFTHITRGRGNSFHAYDMGDGKGYLSVKRDHEETFLHRDAGGLLTAKNQRGDMGKVRAEVREAQSEGRLRKLARQAAHGKMLGDFGKSDSEFIRANVAEFNALTEDYADELKQLNA